MTDINNDQFKAVYSVRGVPVRLLSERGLGDLVGIKAQVHMHTPATNQLRTPIYSVLVGGKVVGQADNIYLRSSRMKVDKKQLQAHLSSATHAKTRNTFVEGIVHPVPVEPAEKKLKIRPGLMVDEETGQDVSTGMAGVHLGPFGARYK